MSDYYTLSDAVPDIFDDVRTFHIATNSPVLTSPQIPPADRIKLREKLINEEHTELMDAIKENDLVKIIDGIGDLIYVLTGTALEYGLPLNTVWNLIQSANMAKVNPETGKVVYNEYNKVMKPEGWTKPDIQIEKLINSLIEEKIIQCLLFMKSTNF